MSDDRYALITGAAGGLGQAVAQKLEQDGWWLALAGRDLSRLRDTYPRSAHFLLAGDVSTPDGAATLLQQCQQQYGQPPQALVHCAGAILVAPLHRTTPEQYRACMAANLDSAFYALSAWVGALKSARQEGAAVLVSSAAARIGTPNHEAVTAAKAGVEGLARAAAATYASAGIRVNAVAPGLMETAATASLISTPAARDAVARQYPLPGIGDPADLAELIAWLLSPSAARVTGQVWSLDGGFSTIRPLVR
jgi:NAD(P)-dependent dehydrogenase (short-subunit alcohol dehydrogenase family)